MIGTSISKRKDKLVIIILQSDNQRKAYIGKGYKWRKKINIRGRKATYTPRIWNIFKILQLKKIEKEYRCKH